MEKDIELIIENMKAAGCSAEDISRVSAMHEAGFESEIPKCLRKCRCDLIDQLHEAQRRLDLMDQLIRVTRQN